ncbi:MAG TPA: trypsin-like peptidase domain-containing protein [Steroidobacteraceae bacterium]|nr:trypsin-like peptidase domain-containing protein [Steroidobacteraceae bacterium]
MDCPKCGHSQTDTVKCESCGIYFAKFAEQQARQAKITRDAEPLESPRSGFGWGAIALTAIASTVLVWVLTRDRTPAGAPSAASAPAAIESPRTGPQATTPSAGRSSPRELRGLEAQLSRKFPARNAIETARNATVFIRTGWGLGSGFIIDEDCHVITNRHVVETDGARVASAVVDTPEMRSRIANAEQQLRANIVQLTQMRDALQGQPGTNMQVIEIDDRIEAMRQDLADLPGRIRGAISDKVEGSARSGFTVILVDGTEFSSLHAEYADSRDLAMFQLPARYCPHLEPGDSMSLAQGERLYTIGNPSGLAYSVTSGIFSGDRGSGVQRLLQTDAPINPGNSGGPLIRENGRVIGINTLVLQGTQGIGFAIPIEAVYQDFTGLRAPSH